MVVSYRPLAHNPSAECAVNSDFQVKLARPIVLLLGLFLYASAAGAAMNGAVRGRVFDARDSEPLARVDVQLGLASNQTITDDEGRFSFTSVQAGDYVLRVSTVGYSLLKRNLRLSPGEVQDFEIVLSPETGRRTDSVNVVSGPFEISRQDNPSEMTLRGSEIKNLSTILCNDPLRAIQGLPGVTSHNDFQSRFSLRGADFNRIGLYLDDVLLHSPFHEVQGDPTLDGVELENSAFSVRYADSTAGVVDARTREGSRVQPTVRATASLASASALAEGPLHEHKGDWLVSIRKSYLDAVLRRAVTDSSLAFGFFDLQGSVGYDLSPRNHLSLSVVDGCSNLDRTIEPNSVGELGILTGDNHFTVANLGWRYTRHDRFLLTNRSASMREKFKNFNRDALPLLGGYYSEWVGSTKGTWLWSKNAGLDFGASLRWIRTDGYLNFPFFNPFANQIILAQLDNFQGAGLREGGFVQQSWKAGGGRLMLSSGVRWDRHSVDQVSAASPQASVAFLLRPSTRINLGWGQYLQYPEMQDFLAFPFTNSRHLLLELTSGPHSSSASMNEPACGWNSTSARTATCVSLSKPGVTVGIGDPPREAVGAAAFEENLDAPRRSPCRSA